MKARSGARARDDIRADEACSDFPDGTLASLGSSAGTLVLSLFRYSALVDGGPKAIGSVTQPVHGSAVITVGGVGVM